MILLAIVLALAPQDAAAAKAAIDAYTATTAKSKDPRAHAEAVGELAKVLHETVAAKLGSLLTTDDNQVRIAAAQALRGFINPPELKVSAAHQLASALTAGANLRLDDVRIAIFEALGALQEESSANAIKSHFEDKESKIACAAVGAAGALKSKTLIDPLINLLRECERTVNAGNTPPPQAPVGKGAKVGKTPPSGRSTNNNDTDKEKRDRASAVGGAAVSALSNLTQQSLRTSDEWEKWWIKNRSSFTPAK
jgi:HEAT repeat protein